MGELIQKQKLKHNNVLCIVGFILLTLSTSVSGKERQIYSWGVVPQFSQVAIQEKWQPVLKEVTKRTGIEFKLKSYASIPDSSIDFSHGKADFIYSNAYQLVMSQPQQGYIPIIKDGSSDLYGVIVVHKDSAIQDIKQLQGKVISVPSLNAFGASLTIRSILKGQQGIEYKERVAGTHGNAFLHVLLQKSDAAGAVYRTFSKEPKAVKDKLRIIYKTPGLPSHPISAHPRVPEKIRTLVKKAFLQMGQDYHGRRLLLAIPIRNPVTTSYDWDYKKLESLGLEKFYID